MMVFQLYGKKIWVADLFDGLPEPDPSNFPEDRDSKLHNFKELVTSEDTIINNFKKYGLLYDKVVFLKGWFKDIMPVATI